METEDTRPTVPDAAVDEAVAERLPAIWGDMLQQAAAHLKDAGHEKASKVVLKTPGPRAPSAAAAFDREAVSELIRLAITRGWHSDGHLAELIAGAVWPLLEHAQAALSGSEGVRLWMLDCGNLVQKHRERAGAAEAKLAAIETLIITAADPVRTEDIRAVLGSEEAGRG